MSILYHIACLICLGLTWNASLIAQEKAVLDNTFSFRDGIYLSHAALLQNKPDVQWGDEPEVFRNPKTQVLKADFWMLGNGDTLLAEEAYALGVEGKPYIRVPEIESPLEAFVLLRVRGKICHFAYPVYHEEEVEVAAYNPLTGKPFRTGTIVNEKPDVFHGMFHFITGERIELSRENLLQWVLEDQALYDAIRELPPDDLTEKLIKSIKIFDDRNPVQIK